MMVVLDSVYNFTPGLDLKDRDVGQLFARIKADICDVTGCTVVLVDHMPWATETNRKRLRSYGDVFKGAAARAGIYIDARGRGRCRGAGEQHSRLQEDACVLGRGSAGASTGRHETAGRGGRGVHRARLRLDRRQPSTGHEGHSKGHGGRGSRVDQTLNHLQASSRVKPSSQDGGPLTGRPKGAKYWSAIVHAGSESSQLFGTTPDDTPKRTAWSQLSRPFRGMTLDDAFGPTLDEAEEGSDDIPF